MLTLEQKQQIFFATRTANYLASMRLEGIVLQDDVACDPSTAIEAASNCISLPTSTLPASTPSAISTISADPLPAAA